MAIQSFYTSLSDTDLAKELLAGNPDAYIQRYVYIGTGVYALTTNGVSTLTPATSPAWTVNELASTVARNLIVVDANSVVATAKIVSNTATAITFNEDDCLLESDGATAASFTPAASYDFYVLTPSSTSGQEYGPFFGYCEGMELSITEEYKTLTYGVPKKKIRRDLVSVDGRVTGGTVNFTNKDVLQAVLNATSYGKNTSGEIAYAMGTSGSCQTQGKYYRLAFKTQDTNCRTVWMVVRKVQFALDGNILGESADGYKMANFNAEMLSDSFYPNGSDLIQIKRGA